MFLHICAVNRTRLSMLFTTVAHHTGSLNNNSRSIILIHTQTPSRTPNPSLLHSTLKCIHPLKCRHMSISVKRLRSQCNRILYHPHCRNREFLPQFISHKPHNINRPDNPLSSLKSISRPSSSLNNTYNSSNHTQRKNWLLHYSRSRCR